MSYNKLLRKIFAESNFTQQELADKCNVSRSYIGALLNNRTPVPSEEISRAIAKACNVDERQLVLEGYLEKAPKEILDFFNFFKNLSSCFGINYFENKIDTNSLKILKERFAEETLNSFIITALEDNKNMEMPNKNMFELKTDNENVLINILSPFTVKVEDNSMYPLIKENDEVSLEMKNKYDNGDIVAFRINNEEKILVRQIVFLGKEIETITLNTKYKRDFYDKNKITIIGKVIKVTTNI